MKAKTLKLLLVLCVISLIDIKAQPHIYYSTQLIDTTYGQLEKIVRYNLATNTVEDFLSQQNIGEYAWPVWDPSQSYLAINVFKWTHTIYDCSNTSNYFELEDFFSVPIDELLYSPQRNNLYIFSHNYEKISVLNLSTGDIISEIDITAYVGYNNLMCPQRNSFFSSDGDSIYFYSLDTLVHAEQVWTYSLNSNEIVEKSNLSELGGYPGSEGYSLTFGRNGKGIIESYPIYYNNPDRDYYFKFYDFETDSGSPFIYHDGESEAYFNGNGEFIIIMDTYLDDSLKYYHTGLVKIYNTQSGNLVKTITLPARGGIYTFDNYPNDIYYVKDIELPTRQIFTLKIDSLVNVLDLSSISPSSVTVNSPPFTLTVQGNGFDTLSTVYFNGQSKTTIFISDSVLTTEILTSDISVVGTYPVWLTDEWATSDTLMFAVNPPPPNLNKISPALGFPSGVFPVYDMVTATVTGELFADSSIVYFNGQSKSTTYISDSVLTFPLLSFDIHTAGNYPVWVSNYGAKSDTIYFSAVDTLPQPVTPVLDCVRYNGDKTFTAFFGYNNQNNAGVYIALGVKNNFSPSPSYRGQPKVFLPDEQSYVFSVDFDGDNITWMLNGTGVTANKKSTPCPE